MTAIFAAAPITLMTLTAIGSYRIPDIFSIRVVAQEGVDRDTAPLAQRIALAEANVRDLESRIAQLDAMVNTATDHGWTKPQ